MSVCVCFYHRVNIAYSCHTYVNVIVRLGPATTYMADHVWIFGLENYIKEVLLLVAYRTKYWTLSTPFSFQQVFYWSFIYIYIYIYIYISMTTRYSKWNKKKNLHWEIETYIRQGLTSNTHTHTHTHTRKKYGISRTLTQTKTYTHSDCLKIYLSVVSNEFSHTLYSKSNRETGKTKHLKIYVCTCVCIYMDLHTNIQMNTLNHAHMQSTYMYLPIYIYIYI